MEQNSPEWHKWRNAGIGASDTPIILGLSEHKTAFELWQEKTGLVTPQDIPLFAKAKGGEVEAQLRAKYSLETGRNFAPVLAEHDDFPILRASLDGYWTDGADEEGIEIKFVGLTKYKDEAIHIPYWWQMQHQMLVMKMKRFTYLKSMDGDSYQKQTVKYEEDAHLLIMKECTDFWDKVITKEPPAKTERDWWDASEEFEAIVQEGDRAKIKASIPHARMRTKFMSLTVSSNGALRMMPR